MNIVVATVRPWNVTNYEKYKEDGWNLITNPKELTVEYLEKVNPRYIFFTHWLWYIPKEIYERWECVLFHMTDLPFGKGGSPLQNLVERGIYESKVTAFKVTKGFDNGDIYFKTSLSLHGNAEEIYMRVSEIAFSGIKLICATEPTPVPQKGETVVFKRRTPEMGELPKENLRKVYDFIRMLDAEEYPNAFIKYGKFKLNFSRASYKDKRIIADVEIREE